jgi:molecular chaperone DnaK
MPKILGIDLGTTFSVVAEFNRNTGLVTVIPDPAGGFAVPSAVYIPPEGDPVVGMDALNFGDFAGESLVRFMKMNMGTTYKKKISGREYTPKEISAEILKKMKSNAVAHLGTDDFESIIITVPAYFGEAATRDTKDAAELAGFDLSKVRIFPEPCAAALAYVAEADAGLTVGPKRVFVSDLGGGTYDATLIETTPVTTPDGRQHLDIQIRKKDGSQQLGGVLWDDELEKHVMDLCAADVAGGHSPIPAGDASLRHGLRERVTRAKILLSTRPSVQISCCAGKSQTVTREQFNELTAALLLQVEEKVRSVREQDLQSQQAANDERKNRGQTPLPVADWDVVLLAGAASAMPQVIQMLQAVTGRQPLVHRTLEGIVALGAAYEAALERDIALYVPPPPDADPGTEPTKIGKPINILSDDIGVVIFDPSTGKHVNEVVLRKDTPAGVEGVRDDFIVPNDNQTAIRFRLREGGDPDPEKCRPVGDFSLQLPPGQPKGAKVMVVLTLGKDQIIVGKGICITTNGPREVELKVVRQ